MFISKPYSREIDLTDIEIMSLITKGYSSSYTIWSAMKKEAKERANGKKVMAYININKRVTELARMGLLEELKPDEHAVNIHGRKDYKVTMKGMEQLVPYFLEHPEAIRDLTDYLNKVGLDKYQFAILLKEKYASATEALNVYQWCTHALYYPFRMHPDELGDWVNKHWDIHKREKKVHNKMIKAQNRMNADMIGITHDINLLKDHFKNMEDEKKKQMTKLEIENNERVIPETEIIPTTDSLEVAKEIGRITNKYYNLESNLPRERAYSDPNTQDFLNELDQAINKYRPEIAYEEITTIDKTKKVLDETVALANEAAERFRQTVEGMKESAPHTTEVIKRAKERVRSSRKKIS